MGCHSRPSTVVAEATLQALSKIFGAEEDLNPFGDPLLRVRNQTIFHVLLETFARTSEVVLLQLTDLELSRDPYILLRGAARKVATQRKDGASLKTRARAIPISEQLSALLRYYLEHVRPRLIRKNRPTLSVFVSGRDGRRISTKTINRMLVEAASKAGVSERIHPHGIRASGLTAFRRQVAPAMNHREFSECITFVGGWSPDSTMPMHYTSQAISQRVGELLRQRSGK